MGVLGTTNISLNSAQVLYGAASGTQRSINDTNIRYLAGIPNSASGSQINMNKLSGAGYFTKTAAGSAIDVRADCVANSWNQSGPVWYIINGNSYSGSTGSAAITISGNFPNGIILQINSGVVVSGKGGAGGNAGYSSIYVNYGGAAGGVALAVTSYTGGSIYIKNDGTLAGGGGGGAGGGGGYYNGYYVFADYSGGGGGGGSGYGSGGAAGQGGGSGQVGSSGTLTSGGAGGTRITAATYSYTSVNGGAGGGQGSSGTSTYHGWFGFKGGGGAGACTTGTVAAGVVWLTTGTRYGTIG